jgi:hypothetical protein
MKFQYSPGLIGYGAKGADGSTGLQGLAIYFTDFNPLSDIITLRSAIENNEVLWSTAIPGTKLPGGRKYSFDDLIVDSRGFVYRVTNPGIGDYIYTGMSLNKSTFFETNNVQSDNGFLRYFNKIDPSSRFSIDNVFTDIPGINYSASPSKIYGIDLKNFTRIEYSNITDASLLYNAFTLYSSGENVITDDQKAFAIVREISSNDFHIGNIDSGNLFRDVDLILDVSSLRYTRGVENRFNKNTVLGTVLTNAEKNTPLLFDNNFNSYPGSFVGATAPSHITLSWNLFDFSNDPSVTGILYFYKKEDASGSYSMDPSVLRPLVFHNVGSSGSIIVSNLTLGRTYEYFMSVCKDGWERNSVIRQITTANTPALFTIVNPSPPTLIANANGIFTPSSLFKYPATILTDSFTGWNLTDIPKPDWISTLQTATNIPITGGAGPGTFNFDISISAGYTGYFSRTGVITFISEAPAQVLSITQNSRPARTNTVRMVTYVDTTSDARGRIVFDPPLDPGQVVTLNAYLHVKAAARGGSHNAQTHTQISLYKNGIHVADTSTYAHTSANPIVCETNDLNFTVTATYGDILEIRQGPTFDCVYWTSGTNGWEEGAAYIRLDSAADGYDTFVIDPAKKFWNVTRISCNSCGTNCYFDSWVDSNWTGLPSC